MLTLPILESGFECSDPDSFHSSIHGGFRNQCEADPHDGQKRILRMQHGALSYRRDEQAGLRFDIEVLEDIRIYDLVARWVLPGTWASCGRILDETVPRGSELYHQHACTELELGTVGITFVGADAPPEGMRAEMYLRSEPDPNDPTDFRWIVHARWIALPDRELWLKHVDGTSREFEGHAVERRVLLRRRELAAPIYDTQIQPHVRLARGTRCTVGLAAACAVPAQVRAPEMSMISTL